MSKYQRLSDALRDRADAVWRASFAELEAVLGFALPKAARAAAWWGAGKPHAAAWADAGWTAEDVDAAGGQVTFRRSPPDPVQPPAMKSAAEAASHEMHRTRAIGVGAIAAGVAVVLVALGALALREIVRRR